MSIADEIQKLEDLRTRGVLSDAEFEEQKARILAGPVAPPPMGGFGAPMMGQGPPPPMPPAYLAQAILATLFCCLPAGIVAIIKSSNVTAAYNSGNYDQAFQASEEAKQWVNYSVIAGVVVIVLYVIMIAAGGLGF